MCNHRSGPAAEQTIRRAELAAALRRLSGAPAEEPLPDGERSVPREELAEILCAFAAARAGRAALRSREDALAPFPDAGLVRPAARAAVNWAVASGFLATRSGGRLAPRDAATRAEADEALAAYAADTATGDAARDDPRNQDGIGSRELLAVSFGTSFNDNRADAVGGVEAALSRAFPAYSVRRAFTSEVIIEHIYRRDGEEIDDVPTALERAAAGGVEELLVQPTHLMNGYEYGDLVQALRRYEHRFRSVRIGAPLLTSDDDFVRVAAAVVHATAGDARDGKTAVCCMGHGTPAAANGVYTRLQRVFAGLGHENYFVGTVEATPTAEDLIGPVLSGGYGRVVLCPLMLVAGDHAHHDMADREDPGSWYARFAAAGLEVRCRVRGLGELPEIQDLLAAHAGAARPLSETGIAVEPNPENRAPGSLPDGVYTIAVESDSAMFQVADCALTVRGGRMEARLTLSGAGYDRLCPGGPEAAQDAGVDPDGRGQRSFTVPVDRLDRPLPFAAHAVKSGRWFARSLTFRSDTAAGR